MEFECSTVAQIKSQGFIGFRTVKELRAARLAGVPTNRGVYLIIRDNQLAPTFLPASTGGHFKKKDPSVDMATLRSRWVATSPVLYIGKGGGEGINQNLFSRLSLYMQFGAGNACGHWGGRYIWQLADADSLEVCWMETPNQEPRMVEKSMIEIFVARHGKRPFANIQG